MSPKLFTHLCKQKSLPIIGSHSINIRPLILVQLNQKEHLNLQLLRNYTLNTKHRNLTSKTHLISGCRDILNYRAKIATLSPSSIRNKSSKMTSYAKHIFETDTEKQDALKSIAKANWLKVKEKESITKTFMFRNFVQAFSFMTAIALEAEKVDHHPEWLNVYNRVEITLTSHFCNGISHLDIKMARNIDKLYANSPKD